MPRLAPVVPVVTEEPDRRLRRPAHAPEGGERVVDRVGGILEIEVVLDPDLIVADEPLRELGEVCLVLVDHGLDRAAHALLGRLEATRKTALATEPAERVDGTEDVPQHFSLLLGG